MTLSLYNCYEDNAENLFTWVPSEEQWWITGFNINYTKPDPNVMTIIGSVDFTENPDMYNEFKSTYETDNETIIFDNDKKTVWIIW